MLVNLICLDKFNFQVVTMANATQHLDCLFIVADTTEHKVYCYSRVELEDLHQQSKFDIEGIVFHTLYPDKLVRWENKLEQKIIVPAKGKYEEYGNNLFILNNKYTVNRILNGLIFETETFEISTWRLGDKIPSITLKSSYRDEIRSNRLYRELGQYSRITKLDLSGIHLENIDLRQSSLISVRSMDNILSRSKCKYINMGHLDLSALESMKESFEYCENLGCVDFSDCYGDIQKPRYREEFQMFWSAPSHPVIIYLNKNSQLFKRVLLKANEGNITLLSGIIKRDENMEQRAKMLLGREMLMKGRQDKNKGYLVLVDKDE